MPSARERYSQSDLGRRTSREWRLRYHYGITGVDWEQMFTRQERACAICRTSEPTKRGWHVDHDHETGRVRGILCAHCNVLLGFAKDNVSTLCHAAAYLQEHRNQEES